MSRDVTISPSQISAMDCRLRWHWQYRKGLRRLGVTPALDLGTGIHHALEAHYGRGEDPARAFDEWATKRTAEIDPSWTSDLKAMMDIRELGLAMINGYVEHYGSNPEAEGFEVLATEKTLSQALVNPLTKEQSPYLLVARLDGLVRDLETGRLFSLEHKTYSRLDTKQFPKDIQFTAQVALGQNLADEMGIDDEVVGVIYNGLRKQAPGPRVKAALYHRERIYRNQRQIDVFLHHAYHKAQEFYGGELVLYPEPDFFKCQRCEFVEPCNAYMIGDDYRHLLRTSYVGRGGHPPK